MVLHRTSSIRINPSAIQTCARFLAHPRRTIIQRPMRLSLRRHELSEAITDPLGTGWYDSSGYENGDECAYFYGFAGYNSGNANELWDGKPFYLQTEYSNVLQNWQLDPNFPGCFNAGPDL